MKLCQCLFIKDKDTLTLCDYPRNAQWVTQVSLLALRMFVEGGKVTGEGGDITRGEERKENPVGLNFCRETWAGWWEITALPHLVF